MKFDFFFFSFWFKIILFKIQPKTIPEVTMMFKQRGKTHRTRFM